MGGKQRDSGTTVQTSEPWSGQEPYLRDLFRNAQAYFGGARPDVGDAAALNQAGVDSLRGAAGRMQPLLNQAQAANQRLVSGELLIPDSNPALQAYIDQGNQLIMNQFTEGVMPQLSGGALVAGNVGGSRQAIVEGLAAGKVMDAVQRNTTGQLNAAYGQGLRALTAGISLAPGTAGALSLPANFYNLAGNQQLDINNLQANQELAYLQNYRDLIGGQQFGGRVATTGPGVRTGGFAGATGGAATGATIGYKIGGGTGAAWGAGIGAVAGYFS